jgi:hypothetical protein
LAGRGSVGGRGAFGKSAAIAGVRRGFGRAPGKPRGDICPIGTLAGMNRPFTIGLGLCIAAASMSAGVATASTSDAGQASRCSKIAGSPVIFSTPKFVVHRASVPGFRGRHDWACARRNAFHALSLGLPFGLHIRDFPVGLHVSRLTGSGRWLADDAVLRGRHEIGLSDVVDGESGGAFTAGPVVGPLHLSSKHSANGSRAAGLVWLARAPHTGLTLEWTGDHRTILKSGGASSFGGGGVIATGAIKPGSVRLHAARLGFDVSFVVGGQHRTVNLRNGGV